MSCSTSAKRKSDFSVVLHLSSIVVTLKVFETDIAKHFISAVSIFRDLMKEIDFYVLLSPHGGDFNRCHNVQ